MARSKSVNRTGTTKLWKYRVRITKEATVYFEEEPEESEILDEADSPRAEIVDWEITKLNK